MSRRTRVVFLISALAALVVAPSAAMAADDSHHLKFTRPEKQQDLNAGQTVTVTLSCSGLDYVTDGMWRVDHVDQANPQTGATGDVRNVVVTASYGDAVNASLWHFRVTNNSGGRAQMKFFLTCLGHSTSSSEGHFHNLHMGFRKANSHAGGPGVVGGFHPTAQNCTPDEVAVAPGFNFSSGSGNPAGSRFSLGGGEPPLYRNWSIAFVLPGPAVWETYYRCLPLKTAVVHSHWHNITAKVVPDLPQVLDTIGPGVTEKRVDCGTRSKGLVGAWDTTGADAPSLHFLGMDPRPKTRAYRFFNTSAGNVQVWTGLLCFRDRVK